MPTFRIEPSRHKWAVDIMRQTLRRQRAAGATGRGLMDIVWLSKDLASAFNLKIMLHRRYSVSYENQPAKEMKEPIPIHEEAGFDLKNELKALKISQELAYQLVEAVALLCSQEDYKTRDNYKRFDNVSLWLSDLVKLYRVKGKQENLVPLIDEFIRFVAMQEMLGGMTETLIFDGAPVKAVAGDSLDLMLRIRAAGHDIVELEGVVAFWKDGTLEPPTEGGGVELSDLLAEARKEGLIS